MTALQRHYRACNLCEAICGLEITVDEAGRIASVRGDADDPFSRGHVCPKAVALQDVYRDPNRLRQPVRRVADGWQTIGWDEAFTEVAARLKEIQTRHGRDAVGVYQGNPSVHNSGTLLAGPPFLRALGTKNRFSATSADQLPHHFAAWLMFGHPLLLPVPDVDRTDFMLILGANPLASNGSMMTAPGIARRLRAIQERGGQFVVVDPRRSETAQAADRHFFIKPAMDVYLLLALINVLTTDKTMRHSDLISAEDVAKLGALAADYTPERVAPRTGIAAADIRWLADSLADAPRAVIYGRMGVSVQAFGGVCQWLINCLNLLTGNFDREGGAMFPLPAFDLLMRARPGVNIFGRWHSSVRRRPEFDGELPVATLAEEIDAGQVKALVTVCGNPVLSSPNGGALDKSLASLDFMAAIDIYVNETTRHADIILPPTTGLETAHYDVAFHHLAVRNTARYSLPLFDKTAVQRHDWEIFEELRQRLEGADTVTPNNPEGTLALGLNFGPYAADGLTLEKLKQSPHGVDLGPLQPCLAGRLLTEDGRVNLLPELLVADLARVAERFAAEDADELLLIGRRHLRSNNSWMHNSARLVKGRDRCTLLMHPETARDNGLSDGQTVKVSSRVGAVSLALEITDGIRPGAVSIPHGYGHARKGVLLDVAAQHAGVSLNDLTDHRLIDELTGNAAFSGVPVRVTAN
jgi:anaerobic selenocysteine-containing dehydrogenase